MIKLNNSLFISKGTNRACYTHPDDFNKCIKIVFSNNFKESKKEIKYLKYLKRKSISWEMMAKYYGTVETNLGVGQVLEMIRDFNGDVSKNIYRYIEDNKLHEIPDLPILLNKLKKYLLQESILVNDLNIVNIVCQKISPTETTLKIIDGTLNNEFIAISTYIKYFAKKKILKKWRKFENILNKKHIYLSDITTNTVNKTLSHDKLLTNPLVSIPLLTYNGAKYLTDQLNSIYSQTYKNIEIIVVDDASTDNTKKILESYKQSHNLKYYINKTNLGINKNFMLALKRCNGDLIAPSDQDDIWDKEKIEIFVNNINEHALISSKSKLIDKNSNIIDYKDLSEFEYSNNIINYKNFIFFGSISAHNMMFKKEIIPYIQDIPKLDIYYDMWICFIAANYGTVLSLSQYLVLHRRHDEQLSNYKQKKNFNIIKNIINKDRHRKKIITNRISILENYLQLKIISNETKLKLINILKSIKKETYFNKKLYKEILSNTSEYMQLKPKNKHKPLAENISRGIWYYRFRLHS